MGDLEHMQYPTYTEVKSKKYTQGWIHKEYPDFYSWINQKYSFCKYWGEKLYCFYNHIDSHPTCPICGKDLSFLDPQLGYRKYCSTKCAHKDPEYLQHIKESCIEKYGVDNVAKAKAVQDKMKSTCLERYGVENALQNASIRDKVKSTCLERYGVENVGILRTADVVCLDKIDDKYIYNCPHPECTKCTEKTYICTREIHNTRKQYNIELCTILHPETPSNNKNTYIEHIVRGWLDDNNVKYETNVKNIIPPKELDIYIPDKHIAIECNGIYWHSDMKKISNKYHLNKFNECKEKGIELITLWEDQLQINPDICKNIILSKLGIYDRRYYARKCIIKDVPKDECMKFLNEYHLQGGIGASVRIGLYYNDELLSVMVFGKTRRCLNDANENWEIYRFCNKGGVQVIGGCSKLFSYFVKKYSPNKIISFSSNDISEGELYKRLGFTFDHETIGYWYVDKNMKRHHRYSFTKKMLVKRGFDPNLSERQIMSQLNYYRIYDSGQKKWEYN